MTSTDTRTRNTLTIARRLWLPPLVIGLAAVAMGIGAAWTMKRVDALGNWLSDPLVLPLDDVTLVSFGDRYLEIFRKYCK